MKITQTRWILLSLCTIAKPNLNRKFFVSAKRIRRSARFVYIFTRIIPMSYCARRILRLPKIIINIQLKKMSEFPVSELPTVAEVVVFATIFSSFDETRFVSCNIFQKGFILPSASTSTDFASHSKLSNVCIFYRYSFLFYMILHLFSRKDWEKIGMSF